MIYYEVVHQVVVLASNFHNILYHSIVFKAWRLVLDPGIVRLGACSFWPLITIRGPKRSQSLAMILSSAAMVNSWGVEAPLISIVNFFT